ncbi:molybdopterin synthase catalytic subunit MoaE [Volucribacter amazonae]|uniref:Molybdopterin synthase catalytic subunit n=1 Tax=Volucribacter amazonae TaxID=256731 RepID=A0A9X4SJ39_9PAST|nr:molybdopterin synthase catalytic subunit MoaE [Volucribacter amazonae]MDG6894054.1 molybdenum cofactor biosynthesis protein MoaE [Volucribacter amazonae]MDG6896355.1 molybdenum cofactor biosynthesis protein MoaE [Volucribacter amazonae]
MDNIKIQVSPLSFDQNEEYQWLAQSQSAGAVVIFVGKVRDLNLGDQVSQLYLEHYPAMTEKVLKEIAEQAQQRWDIQAISIIHRVGQLKAGDEIVLVGVSSAHRKEAYQANEFIMDYLKTKAPFWKKETTCSGERWVEAKQTDDQAMERWFK